VSAEITSTVWGIAPWSDDLLKVSGDVDRGRAELHDYTEQLADDFGLYHRALEAAGIDYRGGDWGGGTADYFRSTVLQAEGFREGIQEAPPARWFDTNTFYRQPVIEGPLEFASAKGHGFHMLFLEGADEPAIFQPTFLSPYAFARLSGRAEGMSQGEALKYVGGLYRGLLDDAAEQGVTHVLFHEPYAPYHQVDKKERAELKHTVGTLAEEFKEERGLQTGIYFSSGDGAEFVRDFAADDRLAAVGCDLTRTSAAELTVFTKGQRLLAGLVDGANTLAQDDGEIAEVLETAAEATGAPEVSLTHTVDLKYVPRAFALDKIKQIGRVARETGTVAEEVTS
jgi:methionine synthase II (cobalamin-independent)